MKTRPGSGGGFIAEVGWKNIVIVTLFIPVLIFGVYVAVVDFHVLLVGLEERPSLILYSRTGILVLASVPIILPLVPIRIWARLISQKRVNQLLTVVLSFSFVCFVFAIVFVMPHFQDRLREAGYHLCKRHAEVSTSSAGKYWKVQAWVLDPNDCRKK